MKKYFIAMIFASMLVSPMAQAAGSYGGLSLGQVEIDEIDTGNIGIVIGNIAESGFGYDLFYSFTVRDDKETLNGAETTAETDIIGLFLAYQTPGDIYLKAKLGYAFVSLKFDVEDQGSTSDTTEDFSYGLAAGTFIGDGALELTYYKFPDFEDFDGIAIDEDVEMLNLTYFWTF
jgi:hypothetical protein